MNAARRARHARCQRSFLPSFGMAKGRKGVLRTSCSGLGDTSHAKSFITAIEKKRAMAVSKNKTSDEKKMVFLFLLTAIFC
jgi:hypothetical protein